MLQCISVLGICWPFVLLACVAIHTGSEDTVAHSPHEADAITVNALKVSVVLERDLKERGTVYPYLPDLHPCGSGAIVLLECEGDVLSRVVTYGNCVSFPTHTTTLATSWPSSRHRR